ncbi:MAG: serine hydrolase domain-containing protein [Candidatus Azotimanducaceae bacterium]
MELVRLPAQPRAAPWPTESWSRKDPNPQKPDDFQRIIDSLFYSTNQFGYTYALLIVKEGELVFEKYGYGSNSFYLQYSWSIAKSITHALVGALVADGKLDIYEPLSLSEWSKDSRSKITIDHLLKMSSGLQFNEDYAGQNSSDVISMLMFEGRHDTAAFAANQPLLNSPGKFWSYSSGSTNIICRVLKRIVGDGANGMIKYMNERLFEPIGIRTATPKFDTSGTFIGSSFLMAIPQDFARFGLLYLRGGVWENRQILSKDWIDYGRTPSFKDESQCYGSHWWINPNDLTQFYASGFEGQTLLLDPNKDTVVLRLGRTPDLEAASLRSKLYDLVDSL